MYKSYCGDYNKEYVKGLIECEGLEILSDSHRNICSKFMKEKGYYYLQDDDYKQKNHCYYDKLECFINKRDQSWKYNWKIKEGIVTTVDDKELVLRSDQFGFSVPRIKGTQNAKLYACEEKYPYWNYLKKQGITDEKIENIVDWIRITRMIGGSFIWPVWKKHGKKEVKSYYNVNRGVDSYIEDSVDLTLYEIKHYYDWINSEENKDKDITKDYTYKDDVLYKTELESEKSPMVTWLDHFGTFEQYIKFFKFDDFVCKDEDGEMVPIDLVDEKPLKDNRVKGYMDDFNKKGKDKKRRIANKERKPEELEKIFNRLSYMTLMRTARMLKVINNSESSKS